MKKYISLIYVFFLAIILLIIILNSDQQFDENIIYGNWAGKLDDKELALTFNQDQTCELFINNLSVEDSLIFIGNFEIDFSKKPISLSIKNISNLDHPIHTIIEFKNKNELRLGDFAKRWRLRPITFDYNKHIILNKGKQSG